MNADEMKSQIDNLENKLQGRQNFIDEQYELILKHKQEIVKLNRKIDDLKAKSKISLEHQEILIDLYAYN